MSYQVLARKWRPQNFNQMVGQSHVLRALVNALDENRLHHAYLFTGTRGVGKTTIARIFAKSLNCEQGVSAQPCGQCRSCVEIAEGRHVDLIEVDAASRTKVEDTRELLDNVQYAPTRGRFKIYLIDEVHMLSGHSFNALLKTLEEPPPHVKFLFATTDPQKLPITILSRCLQFNLKRMPLDMISGHLAHVLQAENITYTEPALTLIARAADGSMRDALSLTDQAIVAGGGQIQAADVQDMLGLLPYEYLVGLVKAVLADDGQQLFAIIEQMAQLTTDFTAAADGLISLLHQIAVQQAVGLYAASAEMVELAQLLTPADTQLYYQLALHGRRDLPLNPDPRSGFEMLLLRLMAFRVAEPIALTEPAVIAPKKKQNLEPKLIIEQTVTLPEPPAALPSAFESVTPKPPVVVKTQPKAETPKAEPKPKTAKAPKEEKPSPEQILESGNVEKAREQARREAIAKEQERKKAEAALSGKAEKSSRQGESKTVVQAGAYGNRDAAESQRAKLAMMGVNANIVQAEVKGQTMYRVQTAPSSKESAAETRKTLQQNGVDSFERSE